MNELLAAVLFALALALFGYGVYIALTASVDTSYEGSATPPASGFSCHQAYSGAASSVPLPSGTDLPLPSGTDLPLPSGVERLTREVKIPALYQNYLTNTIYVVHHMEILIDLATPLDQSATTIRPISDYLSHDWSRLPSIDAAFHQSEPPSINRSRLQ